MVFGLLKTDNFIRFVIGQRDCVPSIVLYNERQISDIKSFCFDRRAGSVLAFDKTFNLGAVYVTPSVYKNVALNRIRSDDQPIFLGPVFIHGKSDFETYAHFFGHLSGRLAGMDFQSLTLGSDDEKSIRKCMMHYFYRAATVACSRHLRENVGRKLDELVGKSSDIRRRLMDSIFGTTGLVTLDNITSFDTAIERLRATDGLLASGPADFRHYFDTRIVPLMRDNCVAGLGSWTNNNCESMNHVLKQAVQWRPNQVPDLIDKLRSIVDGQFAEADRAMIGRGDFVLRPDWAKHRLTFDCWSKMSTVQRQKAVSACFRLPSVPTSTSSDGAVDVPTTPGGGKKLNQKKRCRTERTTTVSKRVKLSCDDAVIE